MDAKQKILVVDDSEMNRAMLKEILGEGYEYLDAENGMKAVEILRNRTDIALVLLDLMMPEMDGFDVLRVMRCYSWLEEILRISSGPMTLVWPITSAARLSGSW